MRKLILLAAAASLACGGDNPSDPGGGNGSDFTVNVVDFAFQPTPLNVPLNSTVTWQWNSGTTLHNVTFPDVPKSADMNTGTYSRTFSVAGTYNYACTLHEGMTGVVTVSSSTSGGGGGNY
jgi:plastocyanin